MDNYFAHNFELVGYHDLDDKPGFKIAMQVVGDRWYLYLAHFWHSGWTIMDVTDPSHPQKAAWIPGPATSSTNQVQVADGKMVTALEDIPVGVPLARPEGEFKEGIFLWDVQDPVCPRLLSQWKTGNLGTHRNHYDGGRYVHCTARMPGFEGHIYVIVDIADPENPHEAGRWFLPEQFVAGGGKPSRSFIALHGPAYPEGDRAYLGYGAAGMVILDISDVTLPRLVSRLDFGSALGSWLDIHTVLPLPRRNLAVVNTEAIEENGLEPPGFAAIVDISDETKPRVMSLFPTPVPPPDAPYANFQSRGGRFGPHNQHHPNHQACLQDRDDLVYLTYFNAGLRVYDIRDPYVPREVGYFMPPDPTKRLGPMPRTLVAQCEDVLVDARGYAYITDKNQGLYVVRYTGG